MSSPLNSVTRRQVLKATASAAIATLPTKLLAGEPSSEASTIDINPTPTHELSPHLYMQFMEPLGTNDSSVEASWDHLNDRWRPELIDVTRSLSPSMVRWGRAVLLVLSLARRSRPTPVASANA